MTYQLGIDLGTTFTAAAIARDSHVEMASLGDRSAAVPSVLFLRPDGDFLVGDVAIRRGLSEPGRVAREFKRRLGDPAPLLLGGTPMPADALLGALLAWVVDRVSEQEGERPARVTITRPANWGPYKRELFGEAISRAGLRDLSSTITEPEAAAIHYASTERLEAGKVVAVYDLGGGTFDAAILRKTADGFEVLGQPEGLERTGGIDFDEAVFGHVAAVLGGALDGLDADDPTTLAAVARLRDDCVAAKEALSTDTDVAIPVLLPTVQTEVRLTRTEFEAMIRPTLAATVSALGRAVQSAGLSPADIHAVLLVGGSSRIPLVGELVAREIGRPVAVDVHPKHAVALGAARGTAPAARPEAAEATAGPATAGEVTAATSPAVDPGEPATPPKPAKEPKPPKPGRPPGTRSRRPSRPVLIGAAVIVVVALAGGGLLLTRKGSSGSSSSSSDTPLTLPAERVPILNSVASDGSGKDFKLATFQVPATPVEVVVGGGAAWIATPDAASVSRIDPATDQPTAIVRVGPTPARIVFAAGSLWTSDTGADTVTRVDPSTNTVTATISVGGTPAGLAATDTSVWISRTDGKVVRIDPGSNAVAQTLDIGGQGADLVAGEGSVWASSGTIPGVLRIDEASSHVGNVIRTGPAPGRVTLGGGSLWVEDESDHSVARVDTKSESVVTRIPFDQEVRGLVVSGNDLWVALPGSNQLARVDITTNLVAGHVTVGTSPSGLAVGEGTVWVCDTDDVKVTRLSE